MVGNKNPESLTRDELISEIRDLLEWSLAVGYYPGKIDDLRFKRLQLLNAENEIRMSAL